jgi:tRNA1(Val) A37 N6-methylase TrmN6
VTIFQPTRGFRVAIDPVLLAAAIPAGPGEAVLDVGSGSGAASLALVFRCDDVSVTGLEVQDYLVKLAWDGAKENGLNGRVRFLEGDLLRPPEELPPGGFDHVMANPPYIMAGQGNLPQDASKRIATVEGAATLADWLGFLLTRVRDGGTITIIHRYDRSNEVITGLRRIGVGNLAIFPLWKNRINAEAKRVIIQAKKGDVCVTRTLPGLVLHDRKGSYTTNAEAVLRQGKALLI